MSKREQIHDLAEALGVVINELKSKFIVNEDLSRHKMIVHNIWLDTMPKEDEE